MRDRLLTATSCALTAALLAAGCGGDEQESDQAGAPATDTVPTEISVLGDPGAAEASPEAGIQEEAGELPPEDEEAVTAAVRSYIDALNHHDGAAVCELLAPGAIAEIELPSAGGCPRGLDRSIGTRPKGGAPAWKRTDVVEVNAVEVSEDRARVTATVTHRFSDRSYMSVEEDVIYLDRSGESWLIAKPSGTLHRAVGYPEPPLRALAPPAH